MPKGQGQNPQAQMFSDPNMAMDMMKKNLSMIIPQVMQTEELLLFFLWCFLDRITDNFFYLSSLLVRHLLLLGSTFSSLGLLQVCS